MRSLAGATRADCGRGRSGRRCGIADVENGESVLWRLVLLEDAHSRDVLRVVQYGPGPPVLEKRHQYLAGGETGQWRNGKVRGFTGLDFATAVGHLEEFQDVLLKPWRSRRAGAEADESAPSDAQREPPDGRLLEGAGRED